MEILVFFSVRKFFLCFAGCNMRVIVFIMKMISCAYVILFVCFVSDGCLSLRLAMLACCAVAFGRW